MKIVQKGISKVTKMGHVSCALVPPRLIITPTLVIFLHWRIIRPNMPRVIVKPVTPEDIAIGEQFLLYFQRLSVRYNSVHMNIDAITDGLGTHDWKMDTANLVDVMHKAA